MGKVVRTLGPDVSTDIIYPGRFMATVLPTETPQYAFADLPFNARLKAGEVSPGSVVVADRNFGCGSSREHAPLALKGCGISAVIAKSFAGIFFRNAINIGLPFLESPDASAIQDLDELEIDLAAGPITNITRNQKYQTQAFPEFLQELIRKGGLMNYISQRAKVKSQKFKSKVKTQRKTQSAKRKT